MLFATDLDKTLIYSKRDVKKCNKNLVCIEELKGEPFSFMTEKAIELFKELNNSIVVVPTTTRSLEQYKRTEMFKLCKYAIITNGGYILENGEPLKDWDEHIQNIINTYKKQGYYEKVMSILNAYTNCYLKEPYLRDDMYVYLRLKDINKYSEMLDVLEDITSRIDEELWEITVQGSKMYVIPKDITKGKALKYLADKLTESIDFVAGDGKLDTTFLELGKVVLIPKGAEVLQYLDVDFKYQEVASGVQKVEELLKIVYDEKEKRNGTI